MEKLPVDCEVLYWPQFMAPAEAAALFDELVSNFDIKDRKIRMVNGMSFESEQGLHFFVDPELVSYDALPEVWGKRAEWTDSLRSLRDRIEEATGARFHVARSVYYEDGSVGMGFHYDPPAYGPTDRIASVSLGAKREFVLRSKEDENDIHRVVLPSGSLLLMGDGCQERYEHGLPEDPACTEARINLTFRQHARALAAEKQ